MYCGHCIVTSPDEQAANHMGGQIKGLGTSPPWSRDGAIGVWAFPQKPTTGCENNALTTNAQKHFTTFPEGGVLPMPAGAHGIVVIYRVSYDQPRD